MLKIAIVEDENAPAELLEQNIRQYCAEFQIPVEIHLFTNAIAFLDQYSAQYDMIFMDIMMPNMNGWDAARKIRSMKRRDAGTIPIIAMSANAFSEDIINSRISGMNQHLTKPLEEAKILAELKECLSR